MATYIVKPNQNLFDIALQLYGSIEGLFDLLITNEKLNMSSELQVGMEIEYHEDFVINGTITKDLQQQSLTPANSERHVYLKMPDKQLVIVGMVDKDIPVISFHAGGEGTMIIDWGDNGDLEYVELSHIAQTIEHYFDNIVDKRRLKIYGDFQLTEFDTSNIGGDILPVRPLVVDEYTSIANGFSLTGLLLFEGTYKVDLRQCSISDLSSIQDMNLQVLDLRGVHFTNVGVLDDYLIYIAENYGTRRDCTVLLSTEPTEKGMEAIKTIINEPEWNKAGKWIFNINDNIYTAP